MAPRRLLRTWKAIVFKQNNSSSASDFFIHFYALPGMTKRGNSLMLQSMDESITI